MRPRLRIFHKIREGYETYAFKCPACNEEHCFNFTWGFDGNFEMPTVSPSILTTFWRMPENASFENVPLGTRHPDAKEIKCHSWITAGKIKFFNDCTHDFIKNIEVDLPEYEPDELL